MTARRQPNLGEWIAWIEAEALLSGWLTVRPYDRVNNRAGAPDMMAARDGVVLNVWVRPSGREPAGLTASQRGWAQALLGPGSGTPTVGAPAVNTGPVVCVLSHADPDERAALRKLMDDV